MPNELGRCLSKACWGQDTGTLTYGITDVGIVFTFMGSKFSSTSVSSPHGPFDVCFTFLLIVEMWVQSIITLRKLSFRYRAAGGWPMASLPGHHRERVGDGLCEPEATCPP